MLFQMTSQVYFLMAPLCLLFCGALAGLEGGSMPRPADARTALCRRWHYQDFTIGGRPMGARRDTMTKTQRRWFAKTYQTMRNRSTIAFYPDGNFVSTVFVGTMDVYAAGRWELSNGGDTLTNIFPDADTRVVYSIRELTDSTVVLATSVENEQAVLSLWHPEPLPAR